MKIDKKLLYKFILRIISKNNEIINKIERDPIVDYGLSRLIYFVSKKIQFYYYGDGVLKTCYLEASLSTSDDANCSNAEYSAGFLNEKYSELRLVRVELVSEPRYERSCTGGSPIPYDYTIDSIPEPNEYTIAYEDVDHVVAQDQEFSVSFKFQICK